MQEKKELTKENHIKLLGSLSNFISVMMRKGTEVSVEISNQRISANEKKSGKKHVLKAVKMLHV